MPKIAPVSYQTLVRVFEKDGFHFQRQRGDHLVYTKPGIPRPLVIPMYDQVPVLLFADMKGSMELLADRDPEEARKLLDPILEHMMEAVHRYEGTVNQVMGDGIMALFGAPLAHSAQDAGVSETVR